MIAAVSGFITTAEERLWPKTFSIKNFVYKYITFRDNQDRNSRHNNYLKWLAKQDYEQNESHSQIYQQLAEVLYQSGQRADAKKVLIYREDLLTQTIKNDRPTFGLSWSASSVYAIVRLVRLTWRHLLKACVDYGYSPLKLLAWFVAIVLAGTLLFSLGDAFRLIVPTENMPITDYCAYSTDKWAEVQRGGNYPHFNPFVYSLEVFVPVVKLNQQAYWQPYDAGCEGSYFASTRMGGIHILRWWLWIETGLGGLFAALTAGGLTSLIRKRSANA